MKKLLQLVYPAEESSAAGGSTSPSESQDAPSTPKTAPPEEEEEEEEVASSSEVKENVVDGFIDCDDDESTTSDQSSTTSGVKGFFSRNTPERLSNLWRKGVSGADEKIRGIWRRNAATGKTCSRGGASVPPQKLRASSEPAVNDAESAATTRKPPSKKAHGKEGSPGTQERNIFHHKNSLTKRKKPLVTVSSDSEKEVQLISFEDAPESGSSFSPVVDTQELVEGSGRHQVLAGDPLGALQQPGGVSPGPPPAPAHIRDPPKRGQSYPLEEEPKAPRKVVGIGRSYTFTDVSSAARQSNVGSGSDPDDECSKKATSTSLWTLNPPFSGEEHHSTPKEILSDANDEDSLATPWMHGFKLPLR